MEFLGGLNDLMNVKLLEQHLADHEHEIHAGPCMC